MLVDKAYKYYICILSMIFIGSMRLFLLGSDTRLSIYLFSDHQRYIGNIFNDINYLFTLLVLSYMLIDLNKVIFKPLFITSVICIFNYFLFYDSWWTLINIPLYFIIAYIYFAKKK